jgi:hypothetical protein
VVPSPWPNSGPITLANDKSPQRTLSVPTRTPLRAQPDFDPSYAVDFWDLTNRQDWAACESVQHGLASPHARRGPLAPDEEAVYQFVSQVVARAYSGPDGSAAEHAAGMVRVAEEHRH